MCTSRACWLPSLVKFVSSGEAQYQNIKWRMTGKDNWCQHLTLTNSAVVMTNTKVLMCITAELSFVKMYLSLFSKLLMDTWVTKVLIGMLKVAINIPMHAFVVKWVFNSCVHTTKATAGEWTVTRMCSFCKKLATSLLKELNFGNSMLWASAPIVSPHGQSELAVVDILSWGHSNWLAVYLVVFSIPSPLMTQSWAHFHVETQLETQVIGLRRL